MFLSTPNPVAFTVFGLDIRWYGICITVGVLLGIILIYKRAPSYRLNAEKIIDVLLISIPAGMVGARLYYVMFHWDNYAGDLGKILNFRTGGLAIHGSLIFGITAAVICCHVWKLPITKLLDLAAPSIAFAQAIGRWGNYFNQEAHGGPTSLPWAIEVNGQMVHPTFLYESLWCLIVGILLLLFARRQKFSGQIFLLYGILYSAERFLVEGLRTDSLMIGGILRTAQVVSVIVFVTFTALYFVLRSRSRAAHSAAPPA